MIIFFAMQIRSACVIAFCGIHREVCIYLGDNIEAVYSKRELKKSIGISCSTQNDIALLESVTPSDIMTICLRFPVGGTGCRSPFFFKMMLCALMPIK